MKKNKTQTQPNMCWTPLYANKHKKTWYLLQTTGGNAVKNVDQLNNISVENMNPDITPYLMSRNKKIPQTSNFN